MNTEDKAGQNEQFRDSLGIVNSQGKRKWIFPKKPKGRFYQRRTIVSLLLLAFLFAMPLIRHNGEPLFLINIFSRKFILFGAVFGTHDFFLLMIAMIASVVFVLLFTAIYGRVFCGWVCPQTVFMEMIFRKIEFLIEGDASKQRVLKTKPWNLEKSVKKISKHIIFFAIAFLIANTFFMWMIGAEALFRVISEPIAMHTGELTGVIAFSILFYAIFAWFREMACIYVCPYGRLQGILLDQNSVVIAYDNLRGEPRGKIRKSENQASLGDCIDCRQCVDVCPTGIDIRNGTQLECVNCTACIDACDFVMDKVGRPRGLVRFASLKGIKEKAKIKFTPRAMGYTVVLVLLMSLFFYLLSVKSDMDISILRTPGLISQEQPGGRISNLYDIKLTNKTFKAMPVELKLKNMKGEIKIIGKELSANPQEIAETKILVILDSKEIKSVFTPLTFEVYSAGKFISEIKSTFVGRIE